MQEPFLKAKKLGVDDFLVTNTAALIVPLLWTPTQIVTANWKTGCLFCVYKGGEAMLDGLGQLHLKSPSLWKGNNGKEDVVPLLGCCNWEGICSPVVSRQGLECRCDPDLG